MKEEARWFDLFSLVFSVIMIALVAIWTIQGDFLTQALETNRSMTWQFIRSTGLTAYILFTVSMIWGLALSSKVVKDWSPGTLSMLLHASVSWLGVGFAAVHALLLLFDEYVTYSVPEILLPLIGPYRPLAVSLGTLVFWIMLLVAVSFSVKKRLGHRRWKLLHMSSYAGFFMVTSHALLAGSDAGRIGFQVMVGLAVLAVVLLTGHRIRAGKPSRPARGKTRAARPVHEPRPQVSQQET